MCSAPCPDAELPCLPNGQLSAEGWAQQLDQPADLAAILLGSLAHCLDNGAALRCFAELRCADVLGERVWRWHRWMVPAACRKLELGFHTPCLHCCAYSKAVRPGGLLVLELPHPSDLWGGYCLEEEQFIEAWEAQVGGGWCRPRLLSVLRGKELS